MIDEGKFLDMLARLCYLEQRAVQTCKVKDSREAEIVRLKLAKLVLARALTNEEEEALREVL